MWEARNPRWLLLALVIIAVGIQFLPANRTNPPEDPGLTVEANTEMPPPIQEMISRACADCHSYRTRWPWYSAIAPVSWMVASDVSRAREHINLSEWAKMEPKDADHTLDEMCEEVEKGEMPLPSYRWMHSEANLSESDVFAFCDWTTEERGRIRSAAGGELRGDNDIKEEDERRH